AGVVRGVRGRRSCGHCRNFPVGAGAGAAADPVCAVPQAAGQRPDTGRHAQRSMKRALVLALLTAPAWAHVVSMSSGEITIDGARAHFELRMPLYEITHVAQPENALLEHIRFRGGGREARLAGKDCHPDRDTYICTADYEFPAPFEALE